MLEVDTDKVSAEVPAPVTGILKEILAKEGDTVQAGAEIAVVEIGGDGKVTATPEAPAPTPKEGVLPTRGEGQAAPTAQQEAPRHPSPLPQGEREPQEPHRYSPGVQMAA